MKSITAYWLIPLACLLVHPALNAQTRHRGFADIEGRKVYYEEKGRGGVLLLIHGQSLDNRMWDDQFEALAKEYRVIRYDMSGYGRSSIPDSPISSSDEIAALLRSLGVKNATIIGMSLGGLAAVRFAIDDPHMVDALITVSANLEGFRFSDELIERLRSYPRIAKDSGLAKAKAAWLKDPFMTPRMNVPSVRAKIRRIITDWSGVQFTHPSIWSFKRTTPPAIRRLGEIHAPTLVMVGEKDDPNMRAIADTLAAGIPGARKVVIAGSGHLLNLEQPEKFNRLVLEFVSANVGGR